MGTTVTTGAPAVPSLLDFSCLPAYEWLSIPAWVYDGHEHRHWWANPAGLRFWRSPDIEELNSRSYADSSEASKARIQLAMQAHARGETTIERWTLYPKGVPSNIILQGTSIRLPSGRVGILYMAELAMQVEPNVVRGIEAMQHATVLVAVHRLYDGAGLLRNTAAALAFGALIEHASGRDFTSMFGHPQQAAEVLAQVAQGGTYRAELQLQFTTGPTWCHFEARPARDPVTGDAVVQINATDISALVEARLALELARSRAEAAGEAKAQFLRNMSHELRTPINGMLPMLHLLGRSGLDSRQLRWVDILSRSARGLAALLSDVLELAHLDARAESLQPVLFHPREALAEALMAFTAESESKQLAFEWSFSDGLREPVYTDLRRVRQVLLNLVSNAIKFTHQGSVQVRIEHGALASGQACLRLEVRDTGVGMTAAELDIIYEPFTQVDGSRTRTASGVGIGLTMVRRVLDILDGTIELGSTPGVGTRCLVSVPLLAPPAGLQPPEPALRAQQAYE
jgi:signal transduction histidine kinase